MEVNGWHNTLHLGFGIAGLALLTTPGRARLFAFSWGATALLLAVWGFTSHAPVAGLVPVNTADDYFHLLDATGLLCALLSPRKVFPVTARQSSVS